MIEGEGEGNDQRRGAISGNRSKKVGKHWRNQWKLSNVMCQTPSKTE